MRSAPVLLMVNLLFAATLGRPVVAQVPRELASDASVVAVLSIPSPETADLHFADTLNSAALDFTPSLTQIIIDILGLPRGIDSSRPWALAFLAQKNGEFNPNAPARHIVLALPVSDRQQLLADMGAESVRDNLWRGRIKQQSSYISFGESGYAMISALDTLCERASKGTAGQAVAIPAALVEQARTSDLVLQINPSALARISGLDALASGRTSGLLDLESIVARVSHLQFGLSTSAAMVELSLSAGLKSEWTADVGLAPKNGSGTVNEAAAQWEAVLPSELLNHMFASTAQMLTTMGLSIAPDSVRRQNPLLVDCVADRTGDEAAGSLQASLLFDSPTSLPPLESFSNWLQRTRDSSPALGALVNINARESTDTANTAVQIQVTPPRGLFLRDSNLARLENQPLDLGIMDLSSQSRHTWMVLVGPQDSSRLLARGQALAKSEPYGKRIHPASPSRSTVLARGNLLLSVFFRNAPPAASLRFELSQPEGGILIFRAQTDTSDMLSSLEGSPLAGGAGAP